MFTKLAIEMIEGARTDCMMNSTDSNRKKLLELDKRLKSVSKELRKLQKETNG